jgi:hypothetical protein
MVRVDMKNCNINVVAFDLAEVKARCHLWRGNRGLKLLKSPCEEETIDLSCVEIKLVFKRVIIIHDTSESDSGVEPHCPVHCNVKYSGFTN